MSEFLTIGVPKPYIKQFGPVVSLPIKAGEDLEINLDSAVKFPRGEPLIGLFPLYFSNGEVFKMTPANYRSYIGILKAPVKQGEMADVIINGVIALPIGKKAVTAMQLVMCENDGAGAFTDVVPMIDLEDLVQEFPATVSAQTDVTLSRSINDIASAVWFDASGAVSAPLTVVGIAPNAGQIWLKDVNTIQLGDQMDDGDHVTIKSHENVGVNAYTVGKALQSGAIRVSSSDYDLVEILLKGF